MAHLLVCVCVKLYHLKFFFDQAVQQGKSVFLGDEFFMLNSWRPCIRPSACRDRSKVFVLELYCNGILEISHFLERIPTEHIDIKNSLDSELQISSICSIRLSSRKL